MDFTSHLSRVYDTVFISVGRAPSVRRLFNDTLATPAVLQFLEDTRVGKMPGRVLMAGGPDSEEDDLKESSLWAQEEGEGPEFSSSEEEDGPSPLL